MNNKTDIDVQYVSPLKKICMTIGELPSSYLETMSYYEMLVWFTEFLKNQVIPTVNNNAEAVQELQTLYEELRTYVNNYFDNLDVQEEINNKLDEMAESGQLTDIIAQYLGLAGMIAFDTVADMKLAENLVNGSKCRTLGYHSVNDGGGAYYKIRQVTNDDVVDEMFIIEVNDDNLVGELITDNLNIKQLGANGVVANDTKALKGFANSSVKTLIIPNGSYLLNDTVDLEDKELIGNENPTITINGITTAREHTIHVGGSCHISNIVFELAIASTNILGFYNANNCIIENCKFNVNNVACNGYVDIYTNNQNIRFVNCDFKCYSMSDGSPARGGLWVREMTNNHTTKNIRFDNCNFDHKSSDEVIACWNTDYLLEDVQINNCFFYLQPETTSQVMVRFDCKNSSINNCVFTYKPSSETARSTLISNNNNNKVEINNCKFDTSLSLSNGLSNGAKITLNNCYFINDKQTNLAGSSKFKNCRFELLSIQGQGSVNLENCNLTISQKTNWNFSGSVDIRKCKFEYLACTNADLFLLFSGGATISIMDSEFTVPSDATQLKIGNFNSKTATLHFNGNIFPSLNVAWEDNVTGYITNNICYNHVTQSNVLTYSNNLHFQ